MPVKRFHAPTLSGALRAVKEAFGERAVILSAREMEPQGWGRPRSRSRFTEVVASDDPLAPAPWESVADPRGPISAAGLQSVAASLESRARSNGNGHDKSQTAEPLEEELREIRSALRRLMMSQGAVNPCQHPALALQMARRLISQGIDPSFVHPMIEEIWRNASPERIADPAWLETAVRREMETYVNIAPLEKTAAGLETALALTGPAGVGKSSCIAKIATLLRLNLGAPVRLGFVALPGEPAPDVILTVGRLLEINVDIIDNIEDVPEYVNTNVGAHKVLIELGLPQRWTRQFSCKSVSILASCPNIETHVVLSSATKLEDLMSLVRWSKETSVSALGFTKLDETQTLGCVFETARRSRAPLSFFSIGRQIPEDLLPATAEQLVEWICDDWRETN
jgi:flagellar biosynthesis protein FlhF